MGSVFSIWRKVSLASIRRLTICVRLLEGGKSGRGVRSWMNMVSGIKSTMKKGLYL